MAALSPGAEYWSTEEALAEAQAVPCVFRKPCVGLGRALDPNSDEDDASRGGA